VDSRVQPGFARRRARSDRPVAAPAVIG
jgi:hypothetical protein